MVGKRGHKGTYYLWRVKHLDRYIREFAGRHNLRPYDTLDQMGMVVRRMHRRSLTYARLVG